MKHANRWLGWLAAVSLEFAALLPEVLAKTETVDGIQWTYTVSGGKATIVATFIRDEDDAARVVPAIPATMTGPISIPATLGGHPVTGIGSNVFDSCDGLTSVTIGDSVTNIGYRAFYNCNGLKTLYVPPSWKSKKVNGGTPEKQKTTNTVGKTNGKLPKAKWKNHVFLGWGSKPEGGTLVRAKSKVTATAKRTLYAHWSTAKGLAITGMSVSGPVTAPAARGMHAGSPVTVRFEADAGRTHEIQWTTSLLGEWETLLEWTSDADGEADVEAPAPAGGPGFYRVRAR